MHALVAALVPLLAPQSGLYDVTVHPREIAIAPSAEFTNLHETEIAVSGARKMAVAIRAQSGIAYGLKVGAGAWTSATVPGSPGKDDPVVVAGPNRGEFIVVGRTPSAAWAARYFPPSASGPSHWDAMQAFTDPSTCGLLDVCVDKTWIARGHAVGEYYVFFNTGHSNSGMAFVKTTDSFSSEITAPVEPTLMPWTTTFNAQPAYAGNGLIYVARRANGMNGTEIRISLVRDNQDGTYDYFKVADAQGNDLGVPIRWIDLYSNYPPIPAYPPTRSQIFSAFMPWLLADPTDADRLFMIYAELAPGSDTDMNVYCSRFERTYQDPANPNNDQWTVDRALVSDAVDVTGTHSDQFLPMAAIDRFGRIHVAFYDNRATECQALPCNAYGVYYTYSGDSGASFVDNRRLSPCAGGYDLEFSTFETGLAAISPREYNGIELDEYDPDLTTVWLSYMGSSGGCPPYDPCPALAEGCTIAPPLIYASRVDVGNPE